MNTNRWKCPHCRATGWGTYGPHDKPHGVSCRKSGQVSEREGIARSNAADAKARRYHAKLFPELYKRERNEP